MNRSGRVLAGGGIVLLLIAMVVSPSATAPHAISRKLAKARRWRRGILWGRIAVAAACLAAAVLGWRTFGWDRSLDVALTVMGVFVLVETATFYLWARKYFAAPASASTNAAAPQGADNPYSDAAKLAITTQGVVLGLVTFGKGSLASTTEKVGASALAAGVLAATILYLNVVQGPPPDMNRGLAASLLFSLVLWALAFGLICIVAASWA
jgi:hypothetical protein